MMTDRDLTRAEVEAIIPSSSSWLSVKVARQLLRCMDERDTFERQLKGVLDREAETYVRLENKIEAAKDDAEDWARKGAVADDALSEAPEVQALIAEATRVKPLVFDRVYFVINESGSFEFFTSVHEAENRGDWLEGGYYTYSVKMVEKFGERLSKAKEKWEADEQSFHDWRIRAATGGNENE
jgi:hypothetical protein